MSEVKIGFLNREYTRRQFMKLTAKGLSGVALSGSLLSLMGITKTQAESGSVEVIAMPDNLLVANKARCTGCQRCELNCSITNDNTSQPYMARLHVRENLDFGITGPTDDYMNGEGSFGNWSYEAETCKQCGDAPCMNICPVQAIYVSEHGGARVIDQEKCIGCGACVIACPWTMPRVNKATNKTTKCINCGTCVRGCPNTALTMIPWEDVAKAMV